MFSRRFVLLAGILVSLNLALWFASPGLALRRALIQQFFGPNMIRVEVVTKKPIGGIKDWHIDRGVITQVSATQLTLLEADTKTQVIPLSSTTKIKTRAGVRLPVSALGPRWRVAVTWPASGPAMSVDVERIPRGHGKKGFGSPAAPASSLS